MTPDPVAAALARVARHGGTYDEETLAAEVRRLREVDETNAGLRTQWTVAHKAQAEAEAALAAERIEIARLREAFVTMERAYNANEAALARYSRHDDDCGP
jgi:chromosome segregation ATPase